MTGLWIILDIVETVLAVGQYSVETIKTRSLASWNLEPLWPPSAWSLLKVLWALRKQLLWASFFVGTVQIHCWRVLGLILQVSWHVYRYALLLSIWINGIQLPYFLRPKPQPRCAVCKTSPYYCTNGFAYQALDSSGDSIRLVRVLPNYNCLKCEVRAFRLCDLPQFTALSYRWTHNQSFHQIQLNGEPFYVRPNLLRYLEALKQDGLHGWNFIDAICINQHDNNERSYQVSLMRDIYKTATEVLAWIRSSLKFPGADHQAAFTDPAAERLHKAIGLLAQGQTLEAELQDALVEREAIKTKMQNFIWNVLLDDEYWTRLWPIQEILLAGKLKFRCDGLIIDWTELESVLSRQLSKVYGFSARYLTPPHRFFQNNLIVQHKIIMMSEIIWRKRKQQELEETDRFMPLHEAIVTFAAQNCSDPRDKIFGLLGVCKAHLKADYNTSVAEVYLRALTEGLVSCLEEREESSSDAVKKVTMFVWSLIFCTRSIFPAGYVPICAGPLIQSVSGLVQNELAAFLFRHFALEKIYYDISRTFFEGRHPWLAKFKEWRYPWLAAILAEMLFAPWYFYSRLPLNVYQVHNSLMALPGSSGDVRTYAEWSNLAQSNHQELVREGVVPHRLTITSALGRLAGDVDKTTDFVVDNLIDGIEKKHSRVQELEDDESQFERDMAGDEEEGTRALIEAIGTHDS